MLTTTTMMMTISFRFASWEVLEDTGDRHRHLICDCSGRKSRPN